MSCAITLSLGSGGDNGMDQAVYASNVASNLILGVRGNRLFQCNPTTGAIIGAIDVGTFGRNGCIAYDQATNKAFMAVWNTPSFALSGGTQVSNRNLYRISPGVAGISLPSIDITDDIVTTFGLASNNLCEMDAGICGMDSDGNGNIYCRYYVCHTPLVGGSGGSLTFKANAIGTFVLDNAGVLGGWPGIAYGLANGSASVFYADQEGGPEVIYYDYGATSEHTISVAPPKNMLAVGFAPNAQNVIVTDVAEAIYVYARTGGAALATIHTGHSNFNGLAVRFNANDGLCYIPGGNDNTVVTVNPSTFAFSIISGFDCPVDVMFAGTTRFAVQAGAVPLKAF